MTEADRIRLRHMLDSARQAVLIARGRRPADLETDAMLAPALIRCLEVLGEAARAVSQESRRSCPQIPWKSISGTRDRLLHGYFDVDLNIVWQIVSSDVPPLISELEKILSEETT